MSSTTQLKYLTLPNNEKYAYRERGSSQKILLLIHGDLGSSYYYQPLLHTPSEEYRVIAPDLRGYGHSSMHNPPNSIDDLVLVDNIKQFVDHLKLEKFALLGWSLGGGLSMKFAARYPDYVEKLILFHAIGVKEYPKYIKDKDGKSAEIRAKTFEEKLTIINVIKVDDGLKQGNQEIVKKEVLETFFTGRDKPSKHQLNAYLNESMRQKSFAVSNYILNSDNISDEYNGVNQGTEEIGKIQCPTLVICGKKDSAVPYQEGEDTARLLGEKAQLEIFEDCGHYCLIDYPQEFLEILSKFLKE